MHLISSLAAGIRGGENGTLRLYARGTSTRAVFYEDFIGSVHPLSGQDVTLDENGSAIVYVNEFVDVVVLDVDGTEVRNFVEGASSPNIEVISNAFTGTDYTSGASGVNKPTNLQSVLDLWESQNGAPDWKVELPGGTEVTVQQAVAGVAGIFINVKDPTYGALGDGVTDDTTPIQNALNAAGTPKSIVLFPAGTYKITAKLTVPGGVSIWGLGSASSIISLSHATADAIEYSTLGSWYQEMRGIKITTSVANTGKLLSVTGVGVFLSVTNCTLDPSSAHTGTVVSLSAAGQLLLDKCSISAYTSDVTGVVDAVAGILHMRDCLVYSGSATYNGTLVSMILGTLIGNTFSLSAMTAGTAIGVAFSATTQATVLGNKFIAGSSTDTAMAITSNTATTQFVEAGNVFTGTWTTTYSGFAAGTNDPVIQMVSRESATRNVTSNSAALALNGHLYGTVVVRRTAAGAQAYSSVVGAPGAMLTIVVYNNIGGGTPLGSDPTFSGGGFYSGTAAITAPTDTKVSVALFRSTNIAGTTCWIQMAAYKTDF